MAAPDISDIPESSVLQQELSNLNQAIEALSNSSPVNFITIRSVSPPSPPPGGPVMPQMDIRVNLDPPITDPTTLADLQAAIQKQADALTKQLTDMGYTNTARKT